MKIQTVTPPSPDHSAESDSKVVPEGREYASNKKIETVGKDLAKRIRSREWSGDESLPPQSQLSKQYGVSPATISIAIRRLQKEGLLHVVPGRGAFVSEATNVESGQRIYSTIGLRGSYVRPEDISAIKTRSYGAAVVQAIWECAQEKHSPLVLLPNASGQGKLGKQYYQSQGVQGVIFLGGESYQDAMELRLAGFPVITANEPPGPTPINYVNCDHAKSLRDIVGRFANAGHRRIGVILSSTSMPGSYQKLKPDFIDALCQAGIQYHIDDYWRFVPHNPSDVEESFRQVRSAVESLLDLPEPVTAIFCFSAYILIEVRKVLEQRGLSVPQDISLAYSTYDRDLQPDVSGYASRHSELARELLDGIYNTIQNPFFSVQKLIPMTFVDQGTILPPRDSGHP